MHLAVHVTIFSTGSKFRPVSNFTALLKPPLLCTLGKLYDIEHIVQVLCGHINSYYLCVLTVHVMDTQKVSGLVI